MARDQHKLSVQQREELKNLYTSGTSIRDLTKMFGLCFTSVTKYLNKMGVKTNGARLENTEDYKFNENVFETINEESAYWAGFLMADGCIAERKYGKSVMLGLSYIDIGHLEKFRKFLGAEKRPIYVIDHKFNTNGYGNVSKGCNLTIASVKMTDDLAKLGVTPHKSGREIACESLKWNKHFWRGMVDGDGSIEVNPNRGKKCYNRVRLCGSETIVSQFKDFVSVFYENRIHVSKHQTANLWYVAFVGRGAYSAAKMLYWNSTISLDRKLAKAQEIIQLYELPDSGSSKEVANVSSVDYPQKQAS